MGRSECGVHRQHRSELLDRRVVLAGAVVVETEIRVDRQRQGIAVVCQFDLTRCLAGTTRGEQEDAEPLMRGRPPWVESDGPPKLGPRPSALGQSKLNLTQAREALGSADPASRSTASNAWRRANGKASAGETKLR